MSHHLLTFARRVADGPDLREKLRHKTGEAGGFAVFAENTKEIVLFSASFDPLLR